jgi:T5SS/PEP-CTERM-associated repeat protein
VHFEITDSSFSQRTYTVDFTNNPRNDQLVVEDDDVTFALFENPTATAHTYTLSNSFVAAAIGTVPNPDRSGKLTVTGGTLSLPEKNLSSATDLEIAPVADAEGVLTVGARGVIDGSPDVFVGLNGNGTLEINSGGAMSADLVTIGVNSNSTGVVRVTGVESSLDAGGIIVGSSGQGMLEVTAGGRINQRALSFSRIGGDFQGAAKIDGVGSLWEARSLSIGVHAQGALDITGGAQVVANMVFVGLNETAQIKVTSTNPAADSILTADSLVVGDNRQGIITTGTLIIQAGGIVNGTVIEIVEGVLSLQGGTLRAAALTFSQPSKFSWTAGTLQVRTFLGNLVVPNGGVLAPNSLPNGRTTVKGSYDQHVAGAVLAVDISAESNFGVLAVEQSALLGGSLQVSLKDGWVPSTSDTFDILQSEEIQSAFANVANGQRLMTSDGLGSFVVNYGPGNPNPNHVILSAFAHGRVLPGDYNQNGVVDAADYVVWRNTRGQSGSGLGADGNGNGQIDAGDYAVWRAHFGQSSGVGAILPGDAPAPAVPESTSAVLLTLGFAAFFLAFSPRAAGGKWHICDRSPCR